MTIPLTVLRYMFEEKYAEMILDGTIQNIDPQDHNEMVQAIMQRSDDILEVVNNQTLCNQECNMFVMSVRKCTQAYTNIILIRYHMKQLYISFLLEGNDPDDPGFKETFAKRAIESEDIMSIHMHHDNDEEEEEDDTRYRRYAIEQAAEEFVSKVNTGKIRVPVTKPSLNYVPSARAINILLTHITP